MRKGSNLKQHVPPMVGGALGVTKGQGDESSLKDWLKVDINA